jgi:hypothetical protein
MPGSGIHPVGLDRCDLGLGAGDSVRHLAYLQADAVDVGRRPRNGDRAFQLADGVEHGDRVGMPVTPRIFCEEPAPARRLHDGLLDGPEISLGEGHGRQP